jgi:quercetin dioxygenase-like cupin family protein
MSTDTRPPTDGQLAKELPGITTFITGHNPTTGDTTIQERRTGRWHSIDSDGMAFNVPFTTSQFPVSMNDDADIIKHDERLNSGKLGIVNPGGTVLRFVDFSPGFESMMHRTQSLDFGIVVEGSIELILDSGDKQRLQRGDVCVQRGTNHAWRNPSTTDWSRVAYVLQDSEPVEVQGKPLKEYLGRSEGDIPPSGND